MIKDTCQIKEMKIFFKMVLDKLGRMMILYRIFSDVKILGIAD